MHVDSRATDLRRSFAALLSSLLPGLGQAFNRRRRPATWFAVPILVLLAVALLVLNLASPSMLIARLIEPSALQAVLILNVLVLVWRLIAVSHAFLDRRYPSKPGRAGLVAAGLVIVFTIAPHAVANVWGQTAATAFDKIFQPGVSAANGQPRATPPPLTERVNVLVVGIDKTPWRTATLTDTMMVVSLDPVGHTVSMLSIPRDLVNVPLGNGSNFGPKLNSLMGYANRHPKEFPDGGMASLEKAVGALLGIPIHYYAQMDFVGFVKMVDAVGGVDIDVDHAFNDPLYDGYGWGKKGYSISAGPHHFDGYEALAYARSRQAVGESDFKRAERQQEVLLGLRDKLLDGGALFWRVPALLSTLGDFVTTDVPVGLLPSLAAVGDEMGRSGVTRAIIKYPLVRGAHSQYGSVQVPDLEKIRAVAAQLFPSAGVAPVPWPTPKPTPKPSASTSP